MVDKKTSVIFFMPGVFFVEHYSKNARNGITIEEVLKEMVSKETIEKTSFETINMFKIVENEWNGYQVVDGKRKEIYGKETTKATCHIGEFYSIERIEQEEGKNSTLYHNISNNGYVGAVRYLTGNFGGVNKGDKVFSQEEALAIIAEGKKERNENQNQPGEE